MAKLTGKQRTDAIVQYIHALAASLKYPGARAFYFPTTENERREQNKRLGREIGFGLASYAANERRKVLGTLYSRLIVANSFDCTGVVIDNKDWISALKEGIEKGLE